MPDIFHRFHIQADPALVYDAISTPVGLDSWWTLRSDGKAMSDAEWHLDLGPGYQWKAAVSRCLPAKEFEFKIVEAMDDWLDTRVGFSLVAEDAGTSLNFRHTGWPTVSEHFCHSSFCWAMYLRLLKRYVESGEVVAYHLRDSA